MAAYLEIEKVIGREILIQEAILQLRQRFILRMELLEEAQHLQEHLQVNLRRLS